MSVAVSVSLPAPTKYTGLYRGPSDSLQTIMMVYRPTPRSKPYTIVSGSANEAPEICLKIFVCLNDGGRVVSGEDTDYWPPGTTYHYTWATSARGEVVAVHGYRLEDGLLKSQKTWVHRRHRRKGLMNELWEFSLARWKPTAVAVYCISPVSYRAMRKIAKRHGGIDWEVTK